MEEGGAAFLEQLDRILSSDHPIDEVGYVHPSQLASLHEGSSHVENSVAESSVFWCGEHKLAISTAALAPLYEAAKSAFIESRKACQTFLGKSKDYNHAGSGSGITEDVHILVKELLSHTRAVVVLNPGFKTAWDVRKQIYENLSIVCPIEELQLSSLILSFSPKSEEAWAHRRWAIRGRVKLLCSCQIPEQLLQEEFKLVTMIADRSRMNYRAWRHCCWLLQWMSPLQMLQELQRWKKWSQLHVAESSCFHFRRCLFEKLSTDDNHLTKVKDAWLDEMDWNKNLIKLYIGREALWLHRRFLFFMWVHHFKHCKAPSRPTESIESPFPEVEIAFANSCIALCIDDDTEDGEKQIACASTYKLWVLLKCKESSTSFSSSQLQSTELLNVEQLLGSKAAHQKALWEGLFGRDKAQSDGVTCSL